jgi:hypothetical protein
VHQITGGTVRWFPASPDRARPLAKDGPLLLAAWCRYGEAKMPHLDVPAYPADDLAERSPRGVKACLVHAVWGEGVACVLQWGCRGRFR